MPNDVGINVVPVGKMEAEVNPLQNPAMEAALRRLMRRSQQHAGDEETKAAQSTRYPLPELPRLEASLTEKLIRSRAIAGIDDKAPDTVLYLAYGSNLSRETFQGRRGIRPVSAVNVVVPSIKLTFDLSGIPYIEPCFANSAWRKLPKQQTGGKRPVASPELLENTDCAHAAAEHLIDEFGPDDNHDENSVPLVGVVYEVTLADFRHILATEGSTYTDTLVECTPISTPTTTTLPDPVTGVAPQLPPFRAHTLLAPPSALYRRRRALGDGKTALPSAQPSARYLGLLRTGAKEHQLPQDWQDYLNGLKAYRATTLGQRRGQKVAMATVLPLFMSMLAIRHVAADWKEKGKVGGEAACTCVEWLWQGIAMIVWLAYDWLLYPLFGDGERREEA